MLDDKTIFRIIVADVKAALIDEQVALSSHNLDLACRYVRLVFQNMATDTITDAVQDFLYDEKLR